MPIAELLGVQVDMQLVLKLSVSVAAVLLVSWVYRFYSSRGTDNHPAIKDNKDSQNATCQNCKTALRCQNSPQCSVDDGNRQVISSHEDFDDTDDLLSHGTEETLAGTHPHQADKSEDVLRTLSCDQDVSTQADTPTDQKQAEVATSNVSFGSALNVPKSKNTGMMGATGRRSPCFLQRLEGIVGVGRELRQDLEHQGAYSSFLSKAEIKVEDANVVLEGTGDEILRGKIYDYYVESSSHSVTDSHTVLGQCERNSETQPVEFGSHVSSPADAPSSLSPIIMRDLVLSQSNDEDVSSVGSCKLRHPARQVLLRKESYLSAAEQCELPTPFITSAASPTIIQSLGSASNEPLSVHPLISPSTDSNAVDLQTVAGAPFLHLAATTLDGTNMESFNSKLDLGNCLETLYLAKKKGQTSVQQAALQVMSDNYLQVLRDPNIYGRLMAGEREQIQRQRTAGRKFVMVADMDPQDWTRSTGGQEAETEQKSTASAVYYYDDYKDSWQTLCLIPQEVISKACAMCTMDNYLFVAVGCQCTDREITPSKRVFCYNPLTSIWKEISSMNEARPRCKLAALEGYVYAIGGECLSSVERYDPRLDRWTFVAPLPNDTFAVAHHVTVCNGELFVSGGTLRYMLLRYSPKTNTWRGSLSVGSKDRTADMVAVGRFLYRFDVNPLLGVSAYRYHTMARVWYECSSKRLLRCPVFQCVTVDGTIYCINRQYTMKFKADEISPAFTEENLSVLSEAKGILIPFVLSLPDKKPRQTSV